MRWELCASKDLEIVEDGATATAVTGMTADSKYILGPEIASGKHAWEVIVNQTRYPDAHVFIGVADTNAKSCKTWSYDPPTGSLYVGDSLNEHGREQRFKVCAKSFALEEKGFVGHVCKVIVNMDSSKRTLAFQIDDLEPVEIKDGMPSKIRPWALLYHKHDSITIRPAAAS